MSIRKLINQAFERFDPKDCEKDLLRKVRYSNVRSICAGLICAGYAILYFTWGYIFHSLVLGGFSLFYLIPLWFSRMGFTGSSRLLFIILSNVLILAFSDFLGREAGIQWSYFSVACISALIFLPRERWQTFIAMALPVVGYATLEVLDYRVLTPDSILKEYQHTISYLMIPTVFFSNWLALSHYSKMQRELENKLETDKEYSEFKFEALYENAPIMIHSFDANKKALLWNNACVENIGYTQSEINHMEGIAKHLQLKLNKAVKSDQSNFQPDGEFREYELLSKDGRRLNQMWANFKLPDGKTMSVGYDITTLKQTKNDLRKANDELDKKVRERTAQLELITETLRQMGNVIDEAFWITEGENHRFIYMSPACKDIWGIPHDELAGMDEKLWLATHPEDRPKVSAAWQKALKPPFGRFDVEYRVTHVSGEVRWVWSRCFPKVTEDGRLTQIYGVSSDITAKKRTEELVEQQRAQMVEASRLAALGEMSGGIAHEVNNPLAVIHGKANQIRETLLSGKPVDTGKVAKDVERIEQTALRIAKIVKSLRQFARDGGADPFESIKLKSVIDDTLELCREKFKNHGIDLKVTNANADWELEGRSTELGQVFLNILMNAFDAVKDQEDRRVNLEVIENQACFEISITDSGPGVPKELREKIMQPFFTTKSVGNGTGLGLSISKGIVETHKGSLTLDETSKQTRFLITLPRSRNASILVEKKAA